MNSITNLQNTMRVSDNDDARKSWSKPELKFLGGDVAKVKNTTMNFGGDGTPSFSTS